MSIGLTLHTECYVFDTELVVTKETKIRFQHVILGPLNERFKKKTCCSQSSATFTSGEEKGYGTVRSGK